MKFPNSNVRALAVVLLAMILAWIELKHRPAAQRSSFYGLQHRFTRIRHVAAQLMSVNYLRALVPSARIVSRLFILQLVSLPFDINIVQIRPFAFVAGYFRALHFITDWYDLVHTESKIKQSLARTMTTKFAFAPAIHDEH